MVIDVALFILLYVVTFYFTSASSYTEFTYPRHAIESSNSSFSRSHPPGVEVWPHGHGWIFIHHVLVGLGTTSQSKGHLQATWKDYTLFANRDRVALVKNYDYDAISEWGKAFSVGDEDRAMEALSVLKDGFIALLHQPEEGSTALRAVRFITRTGLLLTTLKSSSDEGIYRRTIQGDTLNLEDLIVISEDQIPDNLELHTYLPLEGLAAIIQSACGGAVLLSAVGKGSRLITLGVPWERSIVQRVLPTQTAQPEFFKELAYCIPTIGDDQIAPTNDHFGLECSPSHILLLDGLRVADEATGCKVMQESSERSKMMNELLGEGFGKQYPLIKNGLVVVLHDGQIHLRLSKDASVTAAYYTRYLGGWCQVFIATGEMSTTWVQNDDFIVFATRRGLELIPSIPKGFTDTDILQHLGSFDFGRLCVARIGTIEGEEMIGSPPGLERREEQH